MENTEIIGEEETVSDNNKLDADYYYPTAIYSIDKSEWLDTIKDVADEYLKKVKKEIPKLNKLYPAIMSENHFYDTRLKEIIQFTAQTGWNILNQEGFDMSLFEVFVDEWWVQEHHMHSHNEEHVHPYGAQLTGFYFLECPKDCSRVVIHDPRPAKKQLYLPEQNANNISYASTAVNFEPKVGKFMFVPAWLPHSFTRHASKKPFKFIHFNMSIRPIVLRENNEVDTQIV